MNKEDLQKKIGEMESQLGGWKNQIDEWQKNDEVVRKNVSQFLGSFSTRHYDNTKEVKVLRWSEIYFEIGKIMARREEMEILDKMRLQLEYLMQKDRGENSKDLSSKSTN